MRTRTLAYLSLLGGIIALSLSPLFLRWADAPGVTTSFYRMTVAAIVLAIPGWKAMRKQSGAKIPWALLLPGLAAGFFTAGDHGLWSYSLSGTSVANAMLFNYIAPLWVALFAAFVWHEQLRLSFWSGLLLVLSGMVLVVTSNMGAGFRINSGDILAILSSIFYAGYFLFGQTGRRHLPTLTFIWLVAVGASTGLFIITQVLRAPISGFTPTTWLIFLITGLFSQVGGYFMVAYALGHLPAAVVAPSMLASPVLSALLAIPFAGEMLSPAQALGGVIVLAGIWLINRPREAGVPSVPATVP